MLSMVRFWIDVVEDITTSESCFTWVNVRGVTGLILMLPSGKRDTYPCKLIKLLWGQLGVTSPSIVGP